MLALTKKTGYGLIAMTYLSQLEGEELACAREIASRFSIPTRLLMNALKELSAAGYVESVRGAHGGYRLARDPDHINLAELVTVLEGPIRLAKCLSGKIGDASEECCTIMDRCPITDPVHRVQRKLSDFFRTLTLAEIVEEGSMPVEG
jgi:Rrf2 family protein